MEEDPSVLARLQRLQNNYEVRGQLPSCFLGQPSDRAQDYGMRRTVEGVLIVHEHGHPHILMIQIANAFFKLPGDYLKPGEPDDEGLKSRLDERLGPTAHDMMGAPPDGGWEVADCIAQWWRPNFETFMVSIALASSSRSRLSSLCCGHVPRPACVCSVASLSLLPCRHCGAVPYFVRTAVQRTSLSSSRCPHSALY
jgi:hypothetical protein